MKRLSPTIVLSILLFAACSSATDLAAPDEIAAGSTTSTAAATSTSMSTSTSTSTDAVASTDAVTSTTVPPAAEAAEPAWAIQGRTGSRSVIEVIAADGTGRLPVGSAVPGGEQNNPDWSPDGMQLTFSVTGGERDDLWTVNVDGTDPRKVFDCEAPCDYIDDAAWAPDGASIVVCEMDVAGDDHVGSLVSVDVTTGEATTLAQMELLDFCAGPRWSPDGDRLVMEVGHRDETSLDSSIVGVTLSIVDVSVTPATFMALTEPTLFAATADWNDVGDLIVYSALPTPDARHAELFSIKPDGSEITRLTSLGEEGGGVEEPSFNQDGTAVVFVDRARAQILRIDLDSGTITPAFATSIAGRHPRVRPQP